jgi:hypothetical protein
VIQDEATAKRLLRYRTEAKSAFHASLKALEKTLEEARERADDRRDRLEELQRLTGFFVETVTDVAVVAEEGTSESTPGSLPVGSPEEPGAAATVISNEKPTSETTCDLFTPADTLGSRGSDSRNEPNVPGPLGAVGSIVRTAPSRPSHPGPDERGGRSRTSREWSFAADEGGSSGWTRRGPVGKWSPPRSRSVGRPIDRGADDRSDPGRRPCPAPIVEVASSPPRE